MKTHQQYGHLTVGQEVKNARCVTNNTKHDGIVKEIRTWGDEGGADDMRAVVECDDGRERICFA